MENVIERDLVAMLKDMYEIATDRNSRITQIHASFAHHEDYDYISVRALDDNDNVIANVSRCDEKEGNE